MSALFGFALECAAIAVLLGFGASALVLVLAAVLRPLLRRVGPSLRGDLAFLAGALPAIVALAGTAAAAALPIASALGIAPDHCLEHEHHLHVCIVHRALHPELALLGALALGSWSIRGGALSRRLLQLRSHARTLEQLGTTTHAGFPVVRVPGAPQLCHALGSFRRRILLSESLAQALEPGALRCALAHESAHLDRRDPLANLVLSLCGLLGLPFWSSALLRVYRTAAEQACDDAAARVVGDGALVAQALVSVSSLQRAAARHSPAFDGLGFGQHPLETRVRRLLAAVRFDVREARALPAAGWLALGTFALALQHAAVVHHAIETALQGLL